VSFVDRFNQTVFAQALVKAKAKRFIQEFVNKLGPEKMGSMIDQNESIEKIFTIEQLRQIRQLGEQNSWITNIIGPMELSLMLPQWAADLISQKGTQGNSWWNAQLKTILVYLGKEETSGVRSV